MMDSKEIARELGSAANSFSFDKKAFAKELTKEHPTIQQTIMAAFAAYIKEVASCRYYDDRNEASVLFARKIVEKLDPDDFVFPFI